MLLKNRDTKDTWDVESLRPSEHDNWGWEVVTTTGTVFFYKDLTVLLSKWTTEDDEELVAEDAIELNGEAEARELLRAMTEITDKLQNYPHYHGKKEVQLDLDILAIKTARLKKIMFGE